MTEPILRVPSAARSLAAARQLDWLLGEALGAPPARRARSTPAPWLAAAFVALGVGAVFGVAHWRHAADTATTNPQDEEPRWLECHGPTDLTNVPADVRALRCFDFDDAACAQLARFAALERLDLGAMDVDEHGVARSLPITDVGVRSLGKLPKLRWLGLGQCHEVHGYGLRALEALPQLEHLDLTYSGIVTEAVERLPRLPGLRSLVLSHCMGFRGRALAAIATMPGLQRLELAGCTTVTAADALHLAAMPGLRHLDLANCNGHYPGQVSAGFGRSGPDVFVDEDGDGMPERKLDANEEIPDGAATFVDSDGDGLPDLRVDLTPPVEDGIGITDEVVQALAKLPLETLRLGGCTSLTDAIGPALAKMTSLRELDLARLTKLTGTTLRQLPADLRRLDVSHAAQLDGEALRHLARLTKLEELDLSGDLLLRDADLAFLLNAMQLRVLALGDPEMSSKMGPGPVAPLKMPLSAAGLQPLRQQRQLHTLVLTNAQWLTPEILGQVASISALEHLNLRGAVLSRGCVTALAACSKLMHLDLSWTRPDFSTELAALQDLPLRSLNLQRSRSPGQQVRELAEAHWPGCEVVLPNGSKFRTP